MSLLGFDAIGRWAIAQQVASSSFALSAVAGSYSVTGSAATFTTTEAAAGASYAVTVGAAVFVTRLPAIGTSYAETGSAATFLTRLGAIAGVYAVSGFPTGTLIMVTTGGSFIVAGNSQPLQVSLNGTSSSYAVTSGAAHFTRDYVNWFPLAGLSSGWGAIGGPSSAWTPVAAPTSTWTVNPAMAIPQKVST